MSDPAATGPDAAASRRARRLRPERRRALLRLPAGRWARRPPRHDGAGVRHRRPGRPRHDGPQPAVDLPGDLRRDGPQLVLPPRELHDRRAVHRHEGLVPAGHEQPRVPRRLRAPADPAADHDLDLHGPRGRLRLPLRPVQHRRTGPVHRRVARRGVGRLLVREHDAVSPRRARDRRRGDSPARSWRGSPASSRRPSAPTRSWSRSCSTGSCSGRASGCSARTDR